MPTLLATELSNLVNAGLMIEPDVTWITSATVPYGYVISTQPVGGTQVSQWTYVQIYVSFGPQTTAVTGVVPYVVGMSQYAAHQAIGAAGLTWNVDRYTYGNVGSSWEADYTFLTDDTTYATADGAYTTPQGVVIAQSLTAGTVVAEGTVMQITVSLGVPTATVTVTVP